MRRNIHIILIVCFLFWDADNNLTAASDSELVKPITVIRKNEQGKPLKYPSSVFYDRNMNEIYVISSGGVQIYASDYFPVCTIGSSRGVESAVGVYVHKDGKVYVCQTGRNDKKARITILNKALFIEKEIFFDNIPGAETFHPRRVAIGIDNLIYVAGVNTKGVIVLDADGNFLRWLQPKGEVWLPSDLEKKLAAGLMPEYEDEPDEQPSSVSEEIASRLQDSYDIPSELLPTAKKQGDHLGETSSWEPVTTNDVVTDKEGHLYILSEETSKIYVYSPNEELLFSFGQKGGSSGKLSRPRGLALDEKKRSVYVVDYMRHTMLLYDMGGKYMLEFGGKGLSPGWFNYPTSVAVGENGNLIVADLFNQRVQVLAVRFDASFPFFGADKQ